MPQYRLTNEKIANDFFDRRSGFQRLPQGQIIAIVIRQSGKQQAAMPHRSICVVHHIRFQRPAFLVAKVGSHKRHSLAHSASIRCFKCPQIVRRSGKNLANRRHRIQIEKRIAIRFRAPHLQRQAGILFDLPRHQHCLKSFAAILLQFLIAGQYRMRAVLFTRKTKFGFFLADRSTTITFCAAAASWRQAAVARQSCAAPSTRCACRRDRKG